MGLGKSLLVLVTFLSGAAFADAIVKGKSEMWCKTGITSNEPLTQAASTPLTAVTPSTTPDLSGEWQAGCYWAVVKSTKTSPTGEGIYGKSTVFPENVWTKADLNKDPELVKWHGVSVTQDDWRTLKFVSETKKGPFHGLVLDFQNQLNYSGRVGFWRECKSNSHHWKRTYDMPLSAWQTAKWNADGAKFWATSEASGTDKKYDARYLGLQRDLFTLEQDRIVVKTTTWMEHVNYNPKGFNAFPYDFGARICVLKREEKKKAPVAEKMSPVSLQGDDFEKVTYKCRCGCYDRYLTRDIRYRLPGGGHGSYKAALHLVQHQENWGWSHERTMPNVGSAGACRAHENQGCGGYTDLPALGGRWSGNGYLTQCRYTPY